jgi:ATP-dependent 26S proteasome regulatory subunit
MTTNNKHVLDPAIYRKGRVDIDIELQLCDHYQISEIYKSVKQKEIDKDVLRKVQENKYSPADILFHLIHNMYSDVSDDELFSEFY